MNELAPHWQALLAEKALLLFDFDGTIADTTPLHAAAFTQTLAPLGVSVDYSAIAGMKTRDALEECLKRAGLELDNVARDVLIARKQEIVRTRIESGLLPLPGVVEFLRWAREGHRLGMVTSGSRTTVELSMRVLGFDGWFDPMVTADDATRSKPDPQGYLMALKIAGVPAEHAVVFEDSDAGISAARSAGIVVCDVREHSFREAFLDHYRGSRNATC